MNPHTIVIAKRWDGLGARLSAILNAWSVARALGLEFRFVWPRGADIALHEPSELFSDEFLGRFEITEISCADRVVRPDVASLRLPDARVSLCNANPPFLEISECFDVLAFANEGAEAAPARFRAGLHEIGWSRASQALINQIFGESFLQGFSAIHIRAGDIVTGDWRQFLPIEKYTPTPLVEFAIETLSNSDRSPVVVISDNEPYVRYLKNRFNMIRTPSEIVAGYADLTEMQKALADILVLSRARRIVGPYTSAFSGLAANLGGLRIESADKLMAGDDTRRCLRDGIARTEKEADQSDILRPLLARDICWYLDVFSDDLTLGDQISLADFAVRLEPDFCGALNRSAAALARVGETRASKNASLRAHRAAATAHRYADPLVESLATSISSEVLALGGPRDGAFPLDYLGLASSIRRLRGRVTRKATLGRLEQGLSECEALGPFFIHHWHVLFNLRFQIAALAWLTSADNPLREITKATLQSNDFDPLFLPAWRPSGQDILRSSSAIFPQALRNLEVVTILIARAIGSAQSSASPSSVTLGNIDRVFTSPSGLGWVNGWAYDAGVGPAGLAIGYSFDGCNRVSGGVTFLARPDVAEALKDPRAMKCGFSFPVPLDALKNGGVQLSSILISDPKR